MSAQKVLEQGTPCTSQNVQIVVTSGSVTMISPPPMHLQNEDITEDESTPAGTTDLGANEEVSETVTFVDNAGGMFLDLPSSANPVAKVDNTDDLGLGAFLARPTLIDTFTWAASNTATVQRTFKPWYLFLNATPIKKKIDNYAFLRGHLHIKFVLNGTPFQYGAMRACYSPLLGFVTDKIRTNPTDDAPLLLPYSQQPGVFLYPQANAGGEMVCRFFLHKNWLDITSALEVQNMGTINYINFTNIQSAVTGGSTDVTIRAYAWMTDVELMGSTSKLSLQGDEYGTGPISRPATAVASAAAMFAHIPVIGRFARATEIGASAVSSIASLFGYTNVPVISDVEPYHPMNAPMLASAHIGTPVQKLTLDPKQELSIDPSPHGIGSQDELSLSYIKSRESLFGLGYWSTSDSIGSIILNMRVNPNLISGVDVTNASAVNVGRRIYHTPISYTNQMFKHWRGSLIFRFKIVCTKFHKGRIKISYDPRNDISTVDPDENTVYTHIIDIGEKDDFEIEVPYHQDVAWLTTDQTVSANNWNMGPTLAPRGGTDNGLLTIRVLNILTAPAAGNIKVLAFVRGGDDFEFANPAGHIGPDSSNTIPSFFALQGEDITDLESTRYVMGTKVSPHPDRYGLNFGESINSLRNILHRYMVYETTPMTPLMTGMFNIVRKVYKRMPYTPGYDPTWSATTANKVTVATGTAPYIFNTMAHIPYICGMFLGYRGSVNYCVTPSSELYGYVDDIRAVRGTDSGAVSAVQRFLNNNYNVPTGSTSSVKCYNLNRGYYIRDGLAGMGITSTRTNASLSFNIPDYNNYNFSLVDPTTYILGSTTDGTRIQNVQLQLNIKHNLVADPDTASTFAIQSEIAAGPDFTCLHFLCCPTLDYLTNEPVPI